MELSLKTTESFNEVMRLYLPMVYRIAFTRLGNGADAEDVAQDVFFRYYKANKTFVSEEHRKAFLIRCAVNRSNTYAKSAHSRHTVQADISDRAPRTDAADYSEKERRREVLDAVMNLQPDYRTAVYLFYFEDLSISQIAKATGALENTVKSRLSRAREKLKEALSRQDIDFD